MADQSIKIIQLKTQLEGLSTAELLELISIVSYDKSETSQKVIPEVLKLLLQGKIK
jgi:hypothetical protein